MLHLFPPCSSITLIHLFARPTPPFWWRGVLLGLHKMAPHTRVFLLCIQSPWLGKSELGRRALLPGNSQGTGSVLHRRSLSHVSKGGRRDHEPSQGKGPADCRPQTLQVMDSVSEYKSQPVGKQQESQLQTFL